CIPIRTSGSTLRSHGNRDTLLQGLEPNPAKTPRAQGLSAAEHHPRRAALITATSIFFMPIIASNARFASSPPAASAWVSTRGVICQEPPPPVFAPAALALLAAIANNGLPVAVGLLLIVGSDLEGEGFVVLERWTAIETDTGDAGDCEFDR